MIGTKQKILDTAERLIGEQGYAATSLRQIIAEAGVNLASIHYHFGSKEELLDEIILRKAGPVNTERMSRLDRLEAEAGGGPVPVYDVLEAFLLPMGEAADRNPQFVKLMGRMIAEGLLRGIAQKHFQVVMLRFAQALRRALPDLPEDEFLWRHQFMIGAMAHTMCGSPDLVVPGAQRVGFRERIERLIGFAAGGFQAPVRRTSLTEISK